jgi:hypothetical protein
MISKHENVASSAFAKCDSFLSNDGSSIGGGDTLKFGWERRCHESRPVPGLFGTFIPHQR